jgi:hypothetical protein
MAKKRTVTLRLELEVKYEPNGVPERELTDNLLGVAEYAAGVGMFTGETPAEALRWDYKVVRL